MVERYLRQGPLAGLGLAGRPRHEADTAGVRMAEGPFPGIVNLRGPGSDKKFRGAFKAAAGYDLPAEAGATSGSENTTALWLGPDEWWIVDRRGEPDAGQRIVETLRAAVAECPAAITDIGDSRACIRLSGPRARATLQKGCPLDLHPNVFTAGRCAQTRLAKTTAVLHLTDDDSAPGGSAWDVYVMRSFAEYTWLWLEDAAREYGVAVETD